MNEFKERLKEAVEVIVMVIVLFTGYLLIVFPFVLLFEAIGVDFLKAVLIIIGVYYLLRFLKWLCYDPFNLKEGKK